MVYPPKQAVKGIFVTAVRCSSKEQEVALIILRETLQ
jgi:hypothetical protein